MTKAVLLLNSDGVACGAPIRCAESIKEAQAQGLPLFSTVVAQLSAGKELYPNAHGYELFERGKRIGTLEIFAPSLPVEAGADE